MIWRDALEFFNLSAYPLWGSFLVVPALVLLEVVLLLIRKREIYGHLGWRAPTDLFERPGPAPAAVQAAEVDGRAARSRHRRSRGERRAQIQDRRAQQHERRSRQNDRRSGHGELPPGLGERRAQHGERRVTHGERRSEHAERRSPLNERRSAHVERRAAIETPWPRIGGPMQTDAATGRVALTDSEEPCLNRRPLH